MPCSQQPEYLQQQRYAMLIVAMLPRVFLPAAHSTAVFHVDFNRQRRLIPSPSAHSASYTIPI